MLGTRLLTFFSLILITSIFFPQVARADSDPNRGKGQVLFINQVRGRECCDVGSLRALHEQLDVFAELQLPVFFTLRSDAIADPLIVETLQEYRAENTTISLGIFLEITPLLAAESGVAYPTSAERWYEAQAAYLIGYAPEDRIKIIDYVFENFFETFGYYPELTTAWMIDTPSLNYINEKYGVKVHQITREQWGTDSYTLQGGPAHYPYPASRNWLFVPDYAAEATAPATASASATQSAVIVRQTLTDPLANYGDGTASFTSQPNDYLQNKDFSYFEKLFTQAMEQPSGQMGFALIGLENSMPEVSQTEYLRQLQFIHEYAATNQLTFVADLEAFSHYWKTQPVSVYAGENLTTQTGEEIEKAWWITTP